MEADSTTYENCKLPLDKLCLPFNTTPSNYSIIKELTNNGVTFINSNLVEKLQNYGLLPLSVECTTDKPDCKVQIKNARVVDRIQWVCDGCGVRQPIRKGSFFLKLQCSIPQTLQMIFAWCEDADIEVAAQFFGVKPRVATTIYDRLDQLAAEEHSKHLIGGENSVVLAEMYPACLNRFSPDTSDQQHSHTVLMIADTKHIPTHYWLHVIKDNKKMNSETLKSEIEEVISTVTAPGSILVVGNNMPAIEGASTVQQLANHCDSDMLHFLTNRIWSHAITLCAASRDLCTAGSCSVSCRVAEAQKYLDAALQRRRRGDDNFAHMLKLIAEEFTKQNC